MTSSETASPAILKACALPRSGHWEKSSGAWDRCTWPGTGLPSLSTVGRQGAAGRLGKDPPGKRPIVTAMLWMSEMKFLEKSAFKITFGYF